MTDQVQVAAQQAAQTALATAEAMAPAILGAAVQASAAADPRVALVAQLAPVALQLLQNAHALQQAGAMTPDQLAALFTSIGSGIHQAHNAWTALDTPKA